MKPLLAIIAVLLAIGLWQQHTTKQTAPQVVTVQVPAPAAPTVVFVTPPPTATPLPVLAPPPLPVPVVRLQTPSLLTIPTPAATPANPLDRPAYGQPTKHHK